MSQTNLSPFAKIVNPDGTQTQVLVDFFIGMQIDQNVALASLAALAPQAGRRVFVVDSSRGGVPAYGDGTNWRFTSDDVVVS